MNKFLRYFGYFLLALLVIAFVAFSVFYLKKLGASKTNQDLLGEEAPTLTVSGFSFRDLNKDGALDIYEDQRRSTEERVDDLISQMTLEEKAGAMFITFIGTSKDGELMELPTISDPMSFMMESNSELIVRRQMNHFNIFTIGSAEEQMSWHNAIQKAAERTRLGIPITIASDPRHGVRQNIGAGLETEIFSKWPSPLGMAAINDTLLTRNFGNIARQEYRAIGISVALSPMADLATEPRWARTDGTFGEDAAISKAQTKAYILGFQGDTLSNNSVACMTKHFPGGGPQKDGEDAHFHYGADQVYPGDNFDYHLIPFEGAFEAGTAQIMPYYGLPRGLEYEEVAFGFNKGVITGLLREKYGFDGVVCTDWGLITDLSVKPASAWGVEHLSPKERVAKVLDAGCDMFGGEASPQLIIELVKDGAIEESRLDRSLRRILRDKFTLGLFDDPYLDSVDLKVIGRSDFFEQGRVAQRRALTLLKNDNLLPLSPDTKIYLEGISSDLPQVVKSPSQADVIILKKMTPFEPRSESFVEQFFHQGRLDFLAEEKAEMLKLINSKPTVTIMTLERPTVFPEINDASVAVIADFYCEDEIIMDLIFGKFQPTGKLPIELPSSMDAVEQQFEDLPYDTKGPLYPFGHGLVYPFEEAMEPG